MRLKQDASYQMKRIYFEKMRLKLWDAFQIAEKTRLIFYSVYEDQPLEWLQILSIVFLNLFFKNKIY